MSASSLLHVFCPYPCIYAVITQLITLSLTKNQPVNQKSALKMKALWVRDHMLLCAMFTQHCSIDNDDYSIQMGVCMLLIMSM